MNKLYYLIKQELKKASRSRYIMISFILMPLLMWGLQGGVQFLTSSLIFQGDGSGEILYVVNEDFTNSTVELPRSFNLPFDYKNMTAGTNITEIELSDYFIAQLRYQTTDEINNSLLKNYEVNTSLSRNEVTSLAEEGKIKYWIEIPENFAETYTELNFANVTLHYLSSGLTGPINLELGINQILQVFPFSYYSPQDKVSRLQSTPIKLKGVSEEESQFNFGIGIASLLGIMLSVMAPAPFVSTSFAGEREKKTMESLLAMPISRQRILLGKLIAGMLLVSIFAAMNIVGMGLFGFMMSQINYGPDGSNDIASSYLSLDVGLTSVLSITLVMFLSALLSIGIGISIASLTKDVRTSESLYSTLLMIPSIVVGMIGMFSGVPEALSSDPLILSLYLIPWTHALAIFHKISRPGYYDINAIFGSLWLDLLFHFLSLFVIIAIIMFIASKIFEREGIVN